MQILLNSTWALFVSGRFHFITLLFIVWQILCTEAFGQLPNYVTTVSNSFGGSGSEEFFGGSLCHDGGFFLTGLTNSTDGDINPISVYDTSDIFVVRCSPAGQKIWAKTFGGNDYDKARYGMQEADSNFLIIGSTHSIDGDITYTHGNTELFVLKLDLAGDLIWMKQFGGTGYESGRYIMQSSDMNYVAGGYSSSKNFDLPAYHKGFHDGWLFKIDTSGALLWSKSYGGTSVDRIRHFVETPQSDFLFVGSSQSDDFDCTGNHGMSDYWVGKTNSNGDLLWSRQFGGSLEDWPYHVTITNNGSYLITGYSYSNDGDLSGNYGGCDAWLLLLDSAGNFISQKNFGGSYDDRLYKTYQKPNGNFITAGFTQSTDFHLTGVHTHQSKSYWIMELDSNLQILWGISTGGTAADMGKELFYDNNTGSITVYGDSNSSNGNVLGNHGGFDFWLLKLELFTSLPGNEFHTSPEVYYMQQDGNLVIHSGQSFSADFRMYDMHGKMVSDLGRCFIEKGENKINSRLSGRLKSGCYVLKIQGNTFSHSVKLPVMAGY